MKKTKLVGLLAGALISLGIGSCSKDIDKPKETYELVIQYPTLEEESSIVPTSVYLRRRSDARLLWDNYLGSTSLPTIEQEWTDLELEEILEGKLKLRVEGEPVCPTAPSYTLHLNPMMLHPEVPESVEVANYQGQIGNFELRSICYDGSRETGHYNSSESSASNVLSLPLFHHIALGLKYPKTADRCVFHFISVREPFREIAPPLEILLSPETIDIYRARQHSWEQLECGPGCRNYIK